MRLGLFKRIGLTIALAILSGSVAVSLVFDYQNRALLDLANLLQKQAEAIRLQGELDMMHEGILGDVYALSSLTQMQAGQEAIQAVNARLDRHIQVISTHAEQISGVLEASLITTEGTGLQDRINDYTGKATAAAAGMRAESVNHLPLIEPVERAFGELEPFLENISDRLVARTQKLAAETEAVKTDVNRIFIGLLLLALLVSIGFYVFLTVLAPRQLKRHLSKVIESTASTLTGAEELNETSNFLAENASRQAATVEEISASLQDLSAQTIQGSGFALKSIEKGAETTAGMTRAWSSSQSLLNQMQAIKTAGGAVSKFTKTIDEVAFQTNILSLNASVEAARAGNAGLGFAIVADEVRTLAQRTSTSSKEIAALIAKALSSIQTGEQLNNEMSVDLTAVKNQVMEVDAILKELASRLELTAGGLNELTKAITTIDKNTQNIAAASEETAGMVHELVNHATTTEQAVDDLYELIGIN